MTVRVPSRRPRCGSRARHPRFSSWRTTAAKKNTENGTETHPSANQVEAVKEKALSTPSQGTRPNPTQPQRYTKRNSCREEEQAQVRDTPSDYARVILPGQRHGPNPREEQQHADA